MGEVPGQRCAVPWCRSGHWPHDRPDHAAILNTWPFGPGVTLEVRIGQAPDCEPVVRITWLSATDHIKTREISAELAAELAYILDQLDDPARAEFVDALSRAASVLE